MHPHEFCLLGYPTLLLVLNLSNLVIAVSYGVIAGSLLILRVYHTQIGNVNFFVSNPLTQWLLGSFGTFIFLCGATHVMDIVTAYNPLYEVQATLEVLCGLASASTAVFMVLFTRAARSVEVMQPHEDTMV